MPEALRRFGRYIELRTLAAGGMGEIVLAEHTGLSGFSKRVAVKRIRASLAQDPAYVELFLNEARLGSFLNHPNIVHIFDVGRDGDELWLVMEYVEGVDLKRLARRARRAGQPISPTVVAAVAIEVLSALHEAHHAGPKAGAPIIHRDLSPENILIAKSGGVKVLDLGLAKWLPERASVPSMEGNMIFGKVRYMPPEQLRGQFVDPRADLFSLGVTLYETLRGELPFGRGTAHEVLERILAGRPPPPTFDAHADPEMDGLIYRAMTPDLKGRFQSAAEMRDAFLSYMEARPAPRMPLEVLRKMINPSAPSDPVHTEAARPAQLALPVPDRCGKCGGDFVAAFVDDMIVDRCAQCDGIWLDHDEILRLVGPDRETAIKASETPLDPSPLDSLVGSCPVHKVALKHSPVPGHPVSLEVCPVCLGVWFDKGEVELLSHPEVVTWLRFLLDTVDGSR